MTENEIKENWAKRGFSFGTGTISLNDGVEEAVHEDKDELIIMANGKLEFTIGDKSFIQENSEEVLIPAKDIHSIRNVGTEDSIIYFGYKEVK